MANVSYGWRSCINCHVNVESTIPGRQPRGRWWLCVRRAPQRARVHRREHLLLSRTNPNLECACLWLEWQHRSAGNQLRMEGRRRRMVGPVGWIGGAMGRSDLAEDRGLPAGRHDSRARSRLWAMDPLFARTLPAPPHRRSRPALHRSLPPPFCR